jgi:uncharacterized membrane protein YsdA (DUF1294 family)
MKYIWLYLLIINALGFVLMHIDKQKAKKKKWRIPERNLFLIAALGGSPGCILGMYTFRHKTKHLHFTLGMPTIVVIQLLLSCLLWTYLF